MKIKILIPIYNDWESVFKLLENINLEATKIDINFSVIIVNDSSTDSKPKLSTSLDNLKSIQIIHMKENKGHARCNAAGLKYIYEKEDFDYVIPMDGDGEDRPDEILKFLDQTQDFKEHPIVGERIKRSESLVFKTCYQIHKLITLIFTGKSIKFGNFTCLPKTTVEKMVNEKATWNSFSGSLVKIEKNISSIPSIRGKRYYGPSQMNFFSLIKHSLSMISVFRKTFLIRSALFIIFYILIIKSFASVITAIPLIFLLIAVYMVSNLALRENMEEFDKALSNINDTDKIK